MKLSSLSKRRSGIIYLWYWDDHGIRRKASTGCKLKRDAKTWSSRFLAGKTQSKRSKSITVKEFKGIYLDHSKSHHKRKTYLNCKTVFNEFIKFAGDEQLRAIDTKLIQDFIDHKQTESSAATARRCYTAMASAFESAKSWGYLGSNYWRTVKKPKAIERTPLWLNRTEFMALRRVIESDLQRDQAKIREKKKLKMQERDGIENRLTLNRLILIAFNTGLRSGEVRNLRVRSVDVERGILKVQNDEHFSTKSNRERVVILNSTALASLSAVCGNAGSPNDLVFPLVHLGKKRVMDESYLGRKFKHWVIKAKLNPKLRFHDLRHSFASNLVASHVPLYAVGKLLGHSDTKTTEIYSHLSVQDLRGATSILDLPEVVEFSQTEGRAIPTAADLESSNGPEELAKMLRLVLHQMALMKKKKASSHDEVEEFRRN